MTGRTVREELHRLVDDVPIGPPPVDALLVAHRRRRARRTTWLAAAAVVAVAAGGLAAVQWRDPDTAPAPPAPSGTGTPTGVPTVEKLAGAPLSPRYNSLGFWTGTEAIFVGGESRDSLGGPAPFPDLKDGAAFDPETRTWRPITPAPATLGANGPWALTGSTLVVRSWGRSWLAYDIGADQWRRLPKPPIDVPQPTLALQGDRLYVLDVYVEESLAPVQVLDLTTGSWSQLPRSPHEPVLDQRSLVAIPQGIVVMGGGVIPGQAGGRETARAEVWDGTRWRRYPDSNVFGCCWIWTGHRITAAPDGAALDPATGVWSDLQWPVERTDLIGVPYPTHDGPMVLANGYLYDDSTGRFAPVPRPDDFPDQSEVVLGGGRIIAFGGYRIVPDQQRVRVLEVTPTNETWLLPLPNS